MTNQSYGQFCGLARALEVVGEPWALMVVRDLLSGPKSLAALRDGLPAVSDGTLGERLGDLEFAGVLTRGAPESPGADGDYELTEYGYELDDVIVTLSRWGARKLGGPRNDEVITSASMITALRATFVPEAARGLQMTYVLRFGPVTIHASILDGEVDIAPGTVDDPDLIIETGPAINALMAGEISPREALESGSVRLTGDPDLLEWFTELFKIPPAPPAGHVGTAAATAVATATAIPDATTDETPAGFPAETAASAAASGTITAGG